MKLSQICSWLDAEIPVSFQESYDNSGLQVGDHDSEIISALLTLDVTEEVIDEALEHGCNLVISHHPMIFGGIKRIAEKNSTEKMLRKCIKNDLAVYSAHTNLDASHSSISAEMAEKLGLGDVKVLAPLEKKLMKIVTYIPASHLDKVRAALFDAGAGVIGKYDMCGYSAEGTGTFRPGEDTHPFSGEQGSFHSGNEIRFETIFFSHLREKVVSALLSSHPYEEVAYDLYGLENTNIDSGFGCTGIFHEPVAEPDFLDMVAQAFGSRGIRYSDPTGRMIKKVALCGGSGAFLLSHALTAGADAFVTADIKYHNFFEPAGRLLLVDAGHYETEKFAAGILKDLIIKKFPKFALRFSETNTNPINYL